MTFRTRLRNLTLAGSLLLPGCQKEMSDPSPEIQAQIERIIETSWSQAVEAHKNLNCARGDEASKAQEILYQRALDNFIKEFKALPEDVQRLTLENIKEGIRFSDEVFDSMPPSHDPSKCQRDVEVLSAVQTLSWAMRDTLRGVEDRIAQTQQKNLGK